MIGFLTPRLAFGVGLAIAVAGCRPHGEPTVVDESPVEAVDAAAFAAAVNTARASGTTEFFVRGFARIGDAEVERLRDWQTLPSLTLDNSAVTDGGMPAVGTLTGLRYLSLCQTQVTDSGLPALAGLTRLEALRLDRVRITDAGLDALKALPGLRRLSLWRTFVTDDGLAKLKSLPALENLSLDETCVTDAGMKHLAELPRLKYLSVWKAPVSDVGVKALKAKLPAVIVNR